MKKFTFIKMIFLAVIIMAGSVNAFAQTQPTATDATNRTETGFTANWNAVEGATGYKVNVYTKTEPTLTEVINETFSWPAGDNGGGGNDGVFGAVNPPGNVDVNEEDLVGWEYTAAYKGDSCIRLGATSIQGSLTTPAFGISGDAVLTFRAARWETDQLLLALEISGGGTFLDNNKTTTTVRLVTGEFPEYTVYITGATANTKITFRGNTVERARFFIDDVVVAVGDFGNTPITGSPFTVTSGDITSFAVTGLSNTEEYYYTVTALIDTEESPLSNEIGPISLKLPKATATEATEMTSSSFTANWDAVEGATGYKVNVYTKTEPTLTEVINETFSWPAGDNGGGGNDGVFGAVNPPGNVDVNEEDLVGWEYTAAYKGDSCIRLGATSIQGSLTTPAFGISGDAVLTFRAARWGTDQLLLALEISGGGTFLDNNETTTTVRLVTGEFPEYTVYITGATADTKITFRGNTVERARFFIDDVVVAVGDFGNTPITGSPFTVTSGDITSLEVTGLSNTEEYYYTVTALINTEESPLSNEIGPISLLPTGVSNTKQIAANAWSFNGKIMLQATAGEVIEVFNIAGQKVANYLAVDGLNSLDVSLKGIAIVKVGNRISKVTL